MSGLLGCPGPRRLRCCSESVGPGGRPAAEAALTRAGLDLVETEVRAPRSGRVMTTHVEPGEYVQVGKELLVLVSEDLGGPADFKADQLTTRPLVVLLED